jgi:hypothetical protein
MASFTHRIDPYSPAPAQAGPEALPKAARLGRIQSGPVGYDGQASASSRVEDGRAFAESVLRRCEWLTPGDRQLLRSIYADGNPIARLAPMLRTGERALRRRIERLLDRVNSRRFAYVAVRHTHWPTVRRHIAASMVLQGRSLRQTATAMGMSLYSVRRHYEAINALFEASERPGL